MVGRFSSSSPRKKTHRPSDTVAWRRKSKTPRNPETAAVAVPAAALNFHGRLPPLSTSHEDVRTAALEGGGDSKTSSFSTFLGGDGRKIISDELRGFVDEEAMFNMPLVVNSMAEGMLLTPPALKKGFSWSQLGKDDIEIGYTLWME